MHFDDKRLIIEVLLSGPEIKIKKRKFTENEKEIYIELLFAIKMKNKEIQIELMYTFFYVYT